MTCFPPGGKPRHLRIRPESLPAILLCLSLQGCFNSREGISRESPRSWSASECMTVILASAGTNIFTPEPVSMIAVPYFPAVVEAIVRLDELSDTSGSFEAKHRYRLDALLRSATGLYYDWDRGSYFNPATGYLTRKTDIDSLMFMLTLINRGLNSNAPPIDDVEHNILLRNGRGEAIAPKYVWGRKNANLTQEENLLVMFALDDPGGNHFFLDQESVSMEVRFPNVSIRCDISLQYYQ